MWEMRRDPASLSEEQHANLETLFQQIPELRTLQRLRTRYKEIFDTSPNRLRATDTLTDLFPEATEAFPELDGFVKTYERWQEQILNYFERGQTSGVVEGINNKARVITKQVYGIKSAQTLWTRLVLDLNRAGETVTHTIAALRALVQAFRALFSPACAKKEKPIRPRSSSSGSPMKSSTNCWRSNGGTGRRTGLRGTGPPSSEPMLRH